MAWLSVRITELYYRTLLEMGQRHKVVRITRNNGSYIYYTYHLLEGN